MNTTRRRKELRLARQQKRAEIAKMFDSKYVSHAVARIWIIFGGEIEVYKREEETQAKRSPRVMRAIRKLNRQREAQSTALARLHHGQ